MDNAIIKGTDPLTYVQCYSGSAAPDPAEIIATSALTGTVAIASGSPTVTGTGTVFLSELNPGQMVGIVDPATHTNSLMAVKQVVSDTSYIAWGSASANASNLTANRYPVIFAVGQNRGTQIFGNTIQLDKGTLLSCGQGTFRLNGVALSSSLAVTRAPKISLYDSGAGTYTNFTLGMATSVAPTAAAVAGGTKGMQAGNYSIVIAPARTQTLGYNNPSPKVVVTIATNDKVNLTFPAMDTTNGQNAWNVYVTRYADTQGSDLNYLEGPWFFLDQYTGNTAGFTQVIEWLDAEVEGSYTITFNNDPPVAANFVQGLNNVPVFISCQGTNGSSPGPFIFPSKPGNIEAAPTDIAFASSPPETIVGAVSAAGRIYLLTTNHLEIAQGTNDDTVPVLIQPFWSVGFANANQLVFVNDTLYGHSVQGPARSTPQGVSGTEEFDFAAKVSEITDTWNPGHVLVAYDPQNNAVCYFHSADSLNDDGFWTTKILLFGLRQNDWIGQVTLTNTQKDMIVTSAATIGNMLYFLEGGRFSGDIVSIATAGFDVTDNSLGIHWFVAPPFSDYDDELRSHVVKRVRVTMSSIGGSVGVFGAQSGESIPVTALEDGNSSSLTGSVTVPSSTTVTQSKQLLVNCPNLAQSTLRVEGVYNELSGSIDQLHEIVIQSASQGVRE